MVLASWPAWKNALICHIGLGMLVSAPMGVLLYLLPKSARKPVGIVSALVTSAAAPLAVRYEYYMDKNTTSWMIPFLFSTFGFVSFFKSIGAAYGLYPEGADRDLQTWILWYVSFPEPVFQEGKPVPLVPYLDGILEQGGVLLWKLLEITTVLSILMNYHEQENPLPDLLSSMVSLYWLYTFASGCLEIGAAIVMLQGYKSAPVFDNPLIKSRSYRECWGTRWNKPVQTLLKRTVYIPARKVGQSAMVASLLVFAASGMLHEYNFFVHNYDAYVPGHAMMFFMYVGVLMLVEERYLHPFKDGVPTIILSLVLQLPVLPLFSWLFISSYFESGMLKGVSEMVPYLKCQ
jgi:hypothetical protein